MIKLFNKRDDPSFVRWRTSLHKWFSFTKPLHMENKSFGLHKHFKILFTWYVTWIILKLFLFKIEETTMLLFPLDLHFKPMFVILWARSSTLTLFSRDLNFPLRFSRSKFSINFWRQFRERRFFSFTWNFLCIAFAGLAVFFVQNYYFENAQHMFYSLLFH